MGHYAVLDENNLVTLVHAGKDENENGVDWEAYYGAKRTSYNTKGGVHILGGTPFRKNYAGVGYTYDPIRDAFIPPQPFQSWSLNEQTCLWDAPVQYPQDGNDYQWDENTLAWVML